MLPALAEQPTSFAWELGRLGHQVGGPSWKKVVSSAARDRLEVFVLDVQGWGGELQAACRMKRCWCCDFLVPSCSSRDQLMRGIFRQACSDSPVQTSVCRFGQFALS